MSEIITEKDYPIQLLWVLKSMIKYLFLLIFFALILVFYSAAGVGDVGSAYGQIAIIVVYSIIALLYSILRRVTFHYSLGDQFLLLKQGILSRQQRNIPYGVIQNVAVNQDLFDRIFGLTSLLVENAAQGAGALAAMQRGRRQNEIAGFSGNKVSIPGLSRKNAEKLKNIILQKMKENPIEDNQSGL